MIRLFFAVGLFASGANFHDGLASHDALLAAFAGTSAAYIAYMLSARGVLP